LSSVSHLTKSAANQVFRAEIPVKFSIFFSAKCIDIQEVFWTFDLYKKNLEFPPEILSQNSEADSSAMAVGKEFRMSAKTRKHQPISCRIESQAKEVT
jgi:hypothetical protein